MTRPPLRERRHPRQKARSLKSPAYDIHLQSGGVEVNSRHPGHLQVSNYAFRIGNTIRSQIFLGGRKRYGFIAQRSNETPDSFAHRTIIINNRNHSGTLTLERPFKHLKFENID
jgi:hypothetical protein